jgi:hypothetical protein
MSIVGVDLLKRYVVIRCIACVGVTRIKSLGITSIVIIIYIYMHACFIPIYVGRLYANKFVRL